MSGASLKKMLVTGVVIFGLGFCAAQAHAGWWWGAAPSCYGGCGGGWGCGCASAYVPCGGCYSGWYGCGCRHRACSGCGCGWSCGCDPCWSSCCGTSVASWGSPVVSGCGCGGTMLAPAVAPVTGPLMPTPASTPTPAAEPAKQQSAAPAAPAVPPAATAPVMPAEKSATPPLGIPGAAPSALPNPGGLNIRPDGTSTEPTTGDSGILTVWVPNEAKVTINGMLTKSTGSKRHFVSYGLRPGYTYKYVVKAEVVREGKVVKDEQTISLTAGEQGGVAFGFNINEGLAENP